MLGQVGVAGAMATTLMACNFAPDVLTQALLLVFGGGSVGMVLGGRVAVTELP